MILKVSELRSGDTVVDSRNYMRWLVKNVCPMWVRLVDTDPVAKLQDGQPVVFHTTWRIKKDSDVLFKLVG